MALALDARAFPWYMHLTSSVMTGLWGLSGVEDLDLAWPSKERTLQTRSPSFGFSSETGLLRYPTPPQRTHSGESKANATSEERRCKKPSTQDPQDIHGVCACLHCGTHLYVCRLDTCMHVWKVSTLKTSAQNNWPTASP